MASIVISSFLQHFQQVFIVQVACSQPEILFQMFGWGAAEQAIVRAKYGNLTH
jgi:hypothetical protein